MDENEKDKSNPTVVLVLDYFAVGVLLFGLYYAAFILKMIEPSVVTNIFVAALTGLGVYKASAS